MTITLMIEKQQPCLGFVAFHGGGDAVLGVTVLWHHVGIMVSARRKAAV